MARILEREAVKNPMKFTEPVSKEELEMAAYFHWLGRGCPANDNLTDWLEAEQKLVKALCPVPTKK